MKKLIFVSLLLFIFFGLAACSHRGTAVQTADISDLHRYLKYSEAFASSSQPSEEELSVAATSGVERIIYIALNNSHGALKNEDSLVKGLGMQYVYIPVDFKKPTLKYFQKFVAVMQSKPDMNTLLHCQVNLRASVFSFLYRTIFLKVPVAEAKEDMDSIWEPNEVWFRFIRIVADHYAISLDCDGCDWGANEFIEE